jgi:hypothetical protein
MHPDIREKNLGKNSAIPLSYKTCADFRQHCPGGKSASYIPANIVVS